MAQILQPACRSFYAANGWSSFESLRRLGMPTDKPSLAASFPDSLPLHTALAAPSLLARVSAALEEALAAGSFLDVASQLPAEMTPQDAATLLPALPALPAGAEVRGGHELRWVLA